MTVAVGLVGLGRISALHRAALEQIPGVEVRVGIDIAGPRSLAFRGEARPVHQELASLACYPLDLVIVATPTSNHFEVCHALLTGLTPLARLLVEKPMAMFMPEVAALYDAATNTVVDAIFHAAHAPEVVWAARRISGWQAELGLARSCEAFFADPYREMNRGERDRVYVSSWLDSGINALSVCERLLPPERVDYLDAVDMEASVYRAGVSLRSADGECTGTITTSWDVSAPEKWTAIGFASGARLILDHQNVQGRLEHDGQVLDSFAYPGPNLRLVAHYLNAFTALLRAGPDEYPCAARTRLLHGLLFDAV